MSKTFDQGRAEAAKLAEYFKTNRQAFLAPGVKEAHVRQSLIDPFFEALGWDVRNSGMAAPQNREVIPEDSLDVEGQQKAPDYTFRLGRSPMFYAEAKKCGINIHDDPAPAYQLRRYGWSAKVAVSILTDFQELSVYDCTTRPRPSDKAGHARLQYFHFEEYADRWKELWDVFSREAAWSGAFDQYAASKRKRGTSEVDVEFLKELEGWREELARTIALRNADLSPDELNSAVQLTIDRVVFLRMAEDRGIEPCEQLLTLCGQPNIYARFMHDLCRKADEKYNSGLFHFQKEDGVSEAPDRITPKLAVDDKVFKPILQSLYFEHGSPYHFGVLPVEILGTVYERFLGKVIRLTAGHQAKIEEKPEVRKAGGVYYTPAYIVEYIVKNTVGKQTEGRSPAQLAGGSDKPLFRVLDMACGSGSFLLGAYQHLLDHALKWYSEHKPESQKQAVYKDRKGHWRLTVEEKKRILITHIFGVDIDSQAVEVSKLSLLLKVLEGETSESLALGLLSFGDRALPNLSGNIKCGNSLIGPDYFTGMLLPDEDEIRRANPFDWNKGFPAAMKAGGFDCVIGNPPYIRIQTMKEWAPLEVEIYKERFKAAREGNYDIYAVFLEQGLKLLNPQGRLGFICPHKFFNSQYGAPARELIAGGKHLSHVVHFGDQQIFENATTYTCLLFLDKAGAHKCRFVQVEDLAIWKSPENGNRSSAKGTIPSSQITGAEWNFHVGNGAALFRKLSRIKPKLGDVADIFVGLQTSADTVFLFKTFRPQKKGITEVLSAELDETALIESAILKPVIRSGSIGRYSATPTAMVLFPYEVKNGKARLLAPGEMQTRFPLAWRYLSRNRELLRKREHGKFRFAWHQLYPKNLGMWEQPKLMLPYMITRLAAYPDRKDNYYFVNVTTGGFGITSDGRYGSQEYLCALLNSRLLDFYLRRVTTSFHGGYFAANKQFVKLLPIRAINFLKPSDKTAHDRMVNFVASMLALHKQLAAAKSEAHKEIMQRQIDATDTEIDRLVYELYELTPDEIALVEERTRAST